MANAKVVQHRATSYDATDDPHTNMPSAVLPKFSLKPKHKKSKLNLECIAIYCLKIIIIIICNQSIAIASYTCMFITISLLALCLPKGLNKR